MNPERASAYRSPAQRARVVTEAWASDNLYCPCCPAARLGQCRNDREAVDFECASCDSLFQLKSSKHAFGRRIVDGAYEAMARAVASGQVPHLLMLGYMAEAWTVHRLEFVPNFAFTLSSIEKRKPLSAAARRAHWVGCNILIGNVPVDLRISLVHEDAVTPAAEVRQQYEKVKTFGQLKVEQRGWTLDVLNVVRQIGKQRFSLAAVYEYADALSRLHPNNRHVADKIRQQLQVLRDMGFLEFEGRGTYRVSEVEPGCQDR